jgi:hypothetical protein
MWTKLLWLSSKEALVPKIVGGRYFGPNLSGRYRGVLRK